MADIYVYGPIGQAWDDTAMTAHRFAYLMQEAGGEDVTVHINSGGGDVFDANAMAETIRAYKGHVTASIEGLAASAASYFALTADIVLMNPSALLMVHNPWGYCQGTAGDMRSTADMLDKVRETIVGQYVSKTGMDADEVRDLMDAETWLDAEGAVERGFADGLTPDAQPIAACVSDKLLAAYKNSPSDLKAAVVEPPRATEKPVGDGGQIIDSSASDTTPEGAEGANVGATVRVECINGMFIRTKEQK